MSEGQQKSPYVTNSDLPTDQLNRSTRFYYFSKPLDRALLQGATRPLSAEDKRQDQIAFCRSSLNLAQGAVSGALDCLAFLELQTRPKDNPPTSSPPIKGRLSRAFRAFVKEWRA